MAQAMGMNMGSFAAMSSSIAAAGSIMGAAGMVMPGGRLGGVLSSMGAIDPESTYAMGVGSAVKLKRNEQRTQANEVKSGLSSMGKAQANLINSKRELESAMHQATALGGSSFMGKSEDELSRHIAGTKSALQERQTRYKSLLDQGPGGLEHQRRLRAVGDQISSYQKELSQAGYAMGAKVAQRRYNQAQNDFNMAFEGLNDHQRQSLE